METKDRIKAILDYYGLSVNEFAIKAQVKTGQAVYDMLSGKTKSISSAMENKILSCFPEISRAWLLTGEGEMLKASVAQETAGDRSPNINGNGNHNQVAGRDINVSSSDVEKLIDIVNAQQTTIAELVRTNQEQTGRFLSMLEKLTAKD